MRSSVSRRREEPSEPPLMIQVPRRLAPNRWSVSAGMGDRFHRNAQSGVPSGDGPHGREAVDADGPGGVCGAEVVVGARTAASSTRCASGLQGFRCWSPVKCGHGAPYTIGRPWRSTGEILRFVALQLNADAETIPPTPAGSRRSRSISSAAASTCVCARSPPPPANGWRDSSRTKRCGSIARAPCWRGAGLAARRTRPRAGRLGAAPRGGGGTAEGSRPADATNGRAPVGGNCSARPWTPRTDERLQRRRREVERRIGRQAAAPGRAVLAVGPQRRQRRRRFPALLVDELHPAQKRRGELAQPGVPLGRLLDAGLSVAPRPARELGLVFAQLRLRHRAQQSGPQLVVADVAV